MREIDCELRVFYKSLKVSVNGLLLHWTKATGRKQWVWPKRDVVLVAPVGRTKCNDKLPRLSVHGLCHNVHIAQSSPTREGAQNTRLVARSHVQTTFLTFNLQPTFRYLPADRHRENCEEVSNRLTNRMKTAATGRHKSPCER